MSVLIPSPKYRLFDTDGNPLAGGLVETYIAGTSTPKLTYTNSSGAVANTNPVVLDANGEADIWFNTDARYKITVRRSDSTLLWTVDNVGAEASPVLSSVAGASVPAPGQIGRILYVNDGARNILVDAGTRWVPVFEGYDVKSYGAAGDGVADDAAAVNAAIAAIGANAATLRFTRGTYVLGSNVTVPANISVEIDHGALVAPSGGTTLTVAGSFKSLAHRPVFAGAGLQSLTGVAEIDANWWPGTLDQKLTSAIAAAPSGAAINARWVDNTTLASTLIIAKSCQILMGNATWTYAGAAAAIEIRADSVRLTGVNNQVSQLQVTGTAGTEVGIRNSSGTRYFRTVLEHFWIDGADTVGSIAVDARDMGDTMRTEFLRITDFDVGMRLTSLLTPSTTHRSTHTHLEWSSCVTGCYIERCNSHTFYGGRMSGNTYGFLFVTQANNNIIRDVKFETVTYGAYINAGCNHNTFSGCRFEASDILDAGRGTTLTHNYFSDNGEVIDYTGEGGFRLGGVVYNGTAGTSSYLIHPPSGIPAGNRVRNPSFEFATNSAGSIPDHWTFGFSSGSTGTHALDGTVRLFGNSAWRFANTNYNNPRIFQTITTVIGMEYVFSAWARCDTGTNVLQIRLGTSGSGSSEIVSMNVNGDSTWRHYYATFKATAAATTISFYLNTSGVATAWVDGVQLCEGSVPLWFSDERVYSGTVSLDPPSVTANTTIDTNTTILGLQTTDFVRVEPQFTFANPGYFVASAYVSATNTLTVRWVNVTGATIDPVAGNFTYHVTRQG